MKIQKIKHGQKITEPGIYDMPISWYHDDCCDGPSISSSGLRTIETKTPAHYWADSPLNKDRIDEEDSAEKKHFRLGRAAHLLLLEPEKFREIVVTRPAQFDSWRTNAAKEWRARAVNIEGKTVLDGDEFLAVTGIASALRGHALHRDGVLDGDIELSIIWKDQKTGVWLKARPDAIPASANVLADFKTTTDASPLAAYRSVRDFGYDMQLALGGIGMQTVLGRRMTDYVIIFVEVKRPHAILVAPIDSERIGWARLRLRRAVNTFAECLKANRWPSYEAFDGEHVMIADYEKAQIDRDKAAKTLPTEF